MIQQERRCGDCSLCCKALAVGAIPKGRGVWCPHASRPSGGCRIYEDRPSACRSYACAWLQGHPAFDPEDRPDLVGVVGTDVGGEVRLLEDERGALAAPRILELRRRLLVGGVRVVCMPRSGGRFEDVLSR